MRHIALAATLLLVSCSAFAQNAAPASVATVRIKDFDYSPMDISIPLGGSVTWTNLDGEPHTITALDGSFRSGAIDQNESYTRKFDKPGVYQYLCSIHPKMRATITVKP